MSLRGQCWFIFGFYLAPDDTVSIERVVAAIGQSPRGAVLLVSRDFNTNLAALEGRNRGEEITADMVNDGLDYMSAYFLPRRKSWTRNGRTWIMLQ